MSALHVSTGGGLGNRLLSVISGIRLVDTGIFDAFTFSWPPSPECNCTWNAIFERSPYLADAKVDAMVYLPGHSSLGLCVDPAKNAHVKTHGIVLPPHEHRRWGTQLENWVVPAALRKQLSTCAKQVVPLPHIRNAVNELRLAIKPHAGLHVRRTDILSARFGGRAREKYREMNYALLAWLAKEMTVRDDFFFLATEDPDFEQTVTRRFPGRTVIYTKAALPELTDTAIHRSEMATAAGLIDMLALAQTSRIYTDTWSSFSVMAQIIGNISSIERLPTLVGSAGNL